MPRKIVALAPQESLRPLTQALVGAVEILLDEIAALRGGEGGPWARALEERVMAIALEPPGRGADGDSAQIAQSALRSCFRDLRAQLR